MNIKTSQATKSNRRDAGKYKNYSLALQNTITVESDYFVRSIWMSHFLVRFFLFDFLLQLFCPIYLNADFFVWSIHPIFLSYFFWSLFRPTFCPLNVPFFVRSICLIFYPIYVNVRFLVRIFCAIFCPNYLNVRFFRPIFLSAFCPIQWCELLSFNVQLLSLSKIDGQTQLIKSKLFIPCLACANFVMVILLLATFWCSVTMFTKLQFLISNFGTAGVLSLSITVASYQRRILSIKQDIMVFHCIKTKIL